MRYIVIIILAYFVYKYIKYLYGLLAGSSAGHSFSSFNSTNFGNSPKSKVDIKYNPNEGKKDFDEGEYIEFEELDN